MRITPSSANTRGLFPATFRSIWSMIGSFILCKFVIWWKGLVGITGKQNRRTGGHAQFGKQVHQPGLVPSNRTSLNE